MVIGIIFAIVALLFLIGVFQKNYEQKIYREANQVNGGFRLSFPILLNILERELEMVLVTDTGDNFFYQKDIVLNNKLLGKFRIGRKIDYSRNNLIYTELITFAGEKKTGIPIAFQGDTTSENYKKYIFQSYSNISGCSIVFENEFFNYFNNHSLPPQTENTYFHSRELGDIFSSKESFHRFWHSFTELNPHLNGQRLMCNVLDKGINEYTFPNFDGSNTTQRYPYIRLDLIQDRYFTNKIIDDLFFDSTFIKSNTEKNLWLQNKIVNMLHTFSSNDLPEDIYESIAKGDFIFFDVKYNEPPILEYSEELLAITKRGRTYQSTWEDISDWFNDFPEYEFSNFKIQKAEL